MIIDVKQIFESALQEAGAQITEAFGNYSGDAKRFELKFQEFQLFLAVLISLPSTTKLLPGFLP